MGTILTVPMCVVRYMIETVSMGFLHPHYHLLQYIFEIAMVELLPNMNIIR
jgi:hypothetical protein